MSVSFKDVFPLPSGWVVGLSAAEFVTGMLKSAKCKKSYTWGWVFFIVFGACEAILCALISTSIVVEMTKLNKWYSIALYGVAVAGDLGFLVVDLWQVRNLIKREAPRNGMKVKTEIDRKTMGEIVKFVMRLIFIWLPSILVAVLVFARIHFHFRAIAVIDVYDAAFPPLSFWISFTGLSLLLLSSLSLVGNIAQIFDLNDTLNTIFMFGPVLLFIPLAIGGGLRTDTDFVPGFAFLSITTVPPIASFLITIAKDIILDEVIVEAKDGLAVPTGKDAKDSQQPLENA